MSAITAILVTDADGTLHLPVPAELRSRRLRVVATLETVDDDEATESAAAPSAVTSAEQEVSGIKPINAMISTPYGLKPDFNEIRRQIFGAESESDTNGETPSVKPITAMISTPYGLKPDWDEIHRQIYGDDPSKVLTEEDSAFIRDRGDR